jgi:hypothetical protein
MAKIFGAAGEHAARQSVIAFKKMFLTLTGGVAALTLCLGVVWTLLLTKHSDFLVMLLVLVAFALAVFLICRQLSRRIDKFETERMSWRMGALGECQVAAELVHLSNDFTVFNNVNTQRGNLDHVAIGPTGLFAIETKNWSGLIEPTAEGELMKNRKPATAPHVRNFVSRAMAVREQIMALTHRDDFRIRAVMVFPKAHIDARYGSTGKAHCVRLNKLREYIEDSKFSAKFSKERVDELTRAMQGVACMDVDFGDSTTPSVPEADGISTSQVDPGAAG